MTTEYTVYIQESPGAMYIPFMVTADDVESAVRNAAEIAACHGYEYAVKVFAGHAGYHSPDDCLLRAEMVCRISPEEFSLTPIERYARG